MSSPRALLVFVSLILTARLTVAAPSAPPAQDDRFELMDVFELEWASDPQVSPDGRRVVYVRNHMDLMRDRRRSQLWIVDRDGSEHRPLLSGEDAWSPRWSPDGRRLLHVAPVEGGGAQLHVSWMDTGQTVPVTRVTEAPTSVEWSPDGRAIAFSMHVPATEEPLASLPAAPEGAEWAPRARVIRELIYRADGAGYLEPGYSHLFVVPAEGGTPRQVTSGDYEHGGQISWTPDGRALVFSANRHEDWRHDPLDSEVHRVDVETGGITPLTDRRGPDGSPVVSPDGRWIAYVGFDDRRQGYQVRRLHLIRSDGSDARVLTAELDRSVRSPRWSARSDGVYFLYDDHGDTKLAHVDLRGRRRVVADRVGGTSLGRPYAGGSFSVSRHGGVAFTRSSPDRPAEVAVSRRGRAARVLTRLNEDLFAHRQLASVEELWWPSSHDGRVVQGWLVKPPGFDPARKYPLVLEIHGGPFANYGPRFAAEIQLYAAAGYLVLYANPRGSTSYGEEFGNLIHHAYPGRDYDDLMSGVDAVIAMGHVDEERLFVTGGSGGGVLSAWIVGKTDRFRAAVVQKPVINWASFVLTADAYNFFHRYWFPGFPWDHQQHYWERSPLSLVGEVSTPTMVITGEEDHRTPISESEQYYQALRLRRVPAALVRIPGASHGIARRPSQLMTKVAHVLAWFGEHGGEPAP